MASGAVHVTGIKELQRSCSKSTKEIKSKMKGGLIKAAEPVRREAEQRVKGSISNIGPRWSGVKAGSKTSKSAYIAPKARRRGGSPRPNLGALLIDQYWEAAVDKHPQTVRELEHMLDDILDNF